MKGTAVLLKKEFVHLWRSNKVIWLPAVFIILSVMQPLTLYFMEDIMEMSGSLPEGAVIEMPLPSPEEVMMSVLSQLNTIGLLLVIVSIMNIINEERKNGSLVYILVRPVNVLQLVLAKFLAHGIVIVSSFILGYMAAFYYTDLLFGQLQLTFILTSMLLYSMYLLFIIAVVVLASSISDSNGFIAIGTAVFIGLLSLLGGWFPDQMAWSPVQLTGYAADPDSDSGLAGCLAVTGIFIIGSLLGAGAAIRKRSV